MYELLGRSVKRPWGTPGKPLVVAPSNAVPRPVFLRVQENRSHFSNEACACFAAIAALFMVRSIAPALHGQWLVPLFSIMATAGPTFALERHRQSHPASEMPELGNGRISHRDSYAEGEFAGTIDDRESEAGALAKLKLLVAG